MYHTESISRMSNYQKKSNQPMKKTQKTKYQYGSKGFAGMIAIIIMAFGTVAFSLATLGMVAEYADSVSARERRIQKKLNEKACQDSKVLIAIKDNFWDGEINIRELGC